MPRNASYVRMVKQYARKIESLQAAQRNLDKAKDSFVKFTISLDTNEKELIWHSLSIEVPDTIDGIYRLANDLLA